MSIFREQRSAETGAIRTGGVSLAAITIQRWIWVLMLLLPVSCGAPVVAPPNADEAELQGSPQQVATESTPEPKTLKLRIIHQDAETADGLVGALSGVELAAANEREDLVWNVVEGEIIKNHEIIAYLRTSEPSEVQLVIDALHLMEEIKDLGSQRNSSLLLQMKPQQRSYRSGDTINLTLVGPESQHALLFNIGPFGEVDIVYPLESDFVGGGTVWPRLTQDKPLSVSTVAGPPFGTNLAVSVVSQSEPGMLFSTLKSSGGPVGTEALLKAFRETDGQVAATSFQIHR